MMARHCYYKLTSILLQALSKTWSNYFYFWLICWLRWCILWHVNLPEWWSCCITILFCSPFSTTSSPSTTILWHIPCLTMSLRAPGLCSPWTLCSISKSRTGWGLGASLATALHLWMDRIEGCWVSVGRQKDRRQNGQKWKEHAFIRPYLQNIDPRYLQRKWNCQLIRNTSPIRTSTSMSCCHPGIIQYLSVFANCDRIYVLKELVVAHDCIFRKLND